MTVTDEWASDQLDLDAYLARVGHTGDLAPTEQTLRRLHRAHVAAIPFENLDIPLGRTISVELDDVQTKLVHAGRGGYCYEHGVLFAAVLDRLGYSVNRLLARVGDHQGRPPARSHMMLHVHADDQQWLADVGFGAGLIDALPWGDAGPQAQGDWSYQLMPHGERDWQVLERRGDEWKTLYSFDDAPQHASDVLVANHFTATHPSSPFVKQLVVIRKEGDAHLRLHGRSLSRMLPDGSTTERELSDTEIEEALGGRFGIRLARSEITALLGSLTTAQ
ncbi:arylamine N-acetyltransferase [Parasphingorhabdus pacifica]